LAHWAGRYASWRVEKTFPRSRARAGARITDLSVYLALNQFERRRSYKHLERGLQRDMKVFFGD
jgi:hypothetical protein